MRNFLDILKSVLQLLNRQERWQALALGVLMLLGGLLEAVSVGIIMPFIQLLTDPSLLQRSSKLVRVSEYLNLQTFEQAIMAFAVGLLGLYLVKNLFFVFFYHVQNLFFAAKRMEMSNRMFRYFLCMPYMFHAQKNSAELATYIASSMRILDLVWLPMMLLMVELTVTGTIIALLIWVQPVVTIAVIAFFGVSMTLFYKGFRKLVARWQQDVIHYETETRKWFYQSLSAVREVKIAGVEEYFLNQYSRDFDELSTVTRKMNTLSQMPRLFTETIFIVGVVCITIVAQLAQKAEAVQATASLAVFAVAAMRLMPSMNRILLSALALRGGREVLNNINRGMSEIEQATGQRFLAQSGASAVAQDRGDAPTFNREIRFKDVSFTYPGVNSPAVLNLNIVIPRGSLTAFVGHSGAGKSTIVSLLTGLLTPTTGQIMVDDKSLVADSRAWKRMIGYVPQQICLLDDSIRRNVAFGVEDQSIDDALVWEALRLAQLDDVVRPLQGGVATSVGERGVRFSVGQQQRIGIARALYHNPQVLLFDEATSALDYETERAMSKAIQSISREKTIVFIAHRLTTVEQCNPIFFVSQGTIIASGSYSDLFTKNAAFKRFVEGVGQQG